MRPRNKLLTILAAGALYATGCDIPLTLEHEPSYSVQISPDRLSEVLGTKLSYSLSDCNEDGTVDMILAFDGQGQVHTAYFANVETDPTLCDYSSSEPHFQMSAETAKYASQVDPLMLGLAHSLAVDNLYNEQDFADSLERKEE